MSSVLVQFAHPAYSKSVVHRSLNSAAKTVSNVTFNDLYELYPEQFINVKREQELVARHEVLVFQHPFYWYSTPAIIKQWLDLVLEYNWAYGTNGTALRGKRMMSVISCGGSLAAYSAEGYNNYSITDFLLPMRQTATLCGMHYLPPFVVPGTFQIQCEQIAQHATQYQAVLKGLTDGSLDERTYGPLTFMNDLFR
jgi:glutathione-regulated potassium-efflux system ancillary protein KefG